MSNTQAQGSIVLKILVVVAALILLGVILIPGQIWENEDKIQAETLSDIESVYEAQRYYYNLNQEYATDMNVLLTTIHNDSTLKVKKQIVDHTVKLKTAIEGFIEQPIIKSLIKITQNINNIETDFENNKIYFAKFDDISAKSEELNFKILVIKDGVDQENYSMMAKSLDSLLNLRRDLTDYQLQVAARRTHSLTNSIVSKLPEINFAAISEYWNPLDAELTKLMNKVNGKDELKQRTAVADRVADYQQAITTGFKNLNQNNISTEITNSQAASEQVNNVYEGFLSDYLTTEKYVQYSLTDVDSMLLNINEENFYTPREKKLYSFQFMDTLGFVVEDPTLLDELKDRAMTSVEEIKKLSFIETYKMYLNNLDSLHAFALEVKAKYRRNAEVHFKTKDIETLITELKSTSTLSSHENLYKFAFEVPTSNSYSEVKAMVENALLGVGVFEQIAESQIYGKLDTIHLELISEIDSFNELISGIRRNTLSFDNQKIQINESLAQIKSSTSGSNLVEALAKIKQDLQGLFILASDGKDESVYGVFSTSIVNQGKMYGRTGEKSWEDE
jgi:hypothetical protein